MKFQPQQSNPARRTQRGNPARPARGRPSKLNWPEPPSQSPERVADIVLRAKPKKKWRYMEDAQPDEK